MLFLVAFVLCKYFLYCVLCYMAVRILDLMGVNAGVLEDGAPGDPAAA